MLSNPYSNKPDSSFWSRSVSSVGPGMLDPMTENYRIDPGEKVATMGSCFAQHLSRYISSIGLNYYIEEKAPSGMSETEARSKSYGVFSARYGNVYTVRQALQLFDRAFNHFKPMDCVWQLNDGFVDAFRPQIEPEPFSTIETLIRSVDYHLTCVRNIFLYSDWLVFTLGLTEAWASKKDGAIYSMAPGIHGGKFDEHDYMFVNFSVKEVIDDLRTFVHRAMGVNPDLKLILTVSPVPLIATYENRHVLVSTVCSKSILRVAADVMDREFENVVYFPSYEIITNPVVESYFLDNLRKVSPLGVKHVMRVFSKHFVAPDYANTSKEGIPKEIDLTQGGDPDIICDEEEIERTLIDSGLKRA
jgi:hypothetical protein